MPVYLWVIKQEQEIIFITHFEKSYTTDSNIGISTLYRAKLHARPCNFAKYTELL